MNSGNKSIDSFITITSCIIPAKIKRGLPVQEDVIIGHKLGRRNILVTLDSQEQEMRICEIREQFYAGLLPADAPVLVTDFSFQKTHYCGEGSVASVVAAWEAAPLEDYDQYDAKRMIREYGFPEYEISNKAAYDDLKRLYDRCDSCYRHIASHDREFKRLSKTKARDLVFLLDGTQPGWDSTERERRFEDEVRRHHSGLIRTEAEKKAKKQREKQLDLNYKERLPLIQTRNNLTNFPHKAMLIEIMDYGPIEIRHIKAKIREGAIKPESMVRFRDDSDWMELCEFLVDWMRTKATDRQIDFLKSLQDEKGISAEIALDISRKEISARIGALKPPRVGD